MKKTGCQIIILFSVCFYSIAISSPYVITNFGAIPDGISLNTSAIQRAIDTCYARGGGRVIVPSGIFKTGTLRLYSHIDIYLEAGAQLLGSEKVEDYYSLGRKLGMFYAEDATDISITGQGNIDGNGDRFMNLSSAKIMGKESVMGSRQKSEFRKVTEGLGDGPVDPLDRPFQMIIFSNCRNVNLRDILITNSPFWTVHFADCNGVTVSGIRLWNNVMIPNSDGLDFTSCSNIIISDSDIRTGDDALVFGGYDRHFDLPGFRGIRCDSENITVTNCTLMSRSSAIRIGGADQNNMRNYVFSNLVIYESNRGIGLFVREEGSIENMVFSHIVIHTRLHTGDWWGNGEPIHISAVRNIKGEPLGKIRNIRFSDIICSGESGIILLGTDESILQDIVFSNLQLRIKNSAMQASSGGNVDLRPVLDPRLQLFSHDVPAFYGENIKNLTLSNIEISWDEVSESFFTHGLEIACFQHLTINGFAGGPAHGSKQLAAIHLCNGKGYRISNAETYNKKNKLLIRDKVNKRL